MADSQIVSRVNTIAVTDGQRYQPMNMTERISSEGDESKNLISSTLGMIKNKFWELVYDEGIVGFDPNVNFAYQEAMNDSSKIIAYKGRVFYQHPGVGAIKAFNDDGCPAQGCFTMITMA